MPPVRVTDTRANRNETIVNVATALGRSKNRRRLFEAVYWHKRATKTVDELREKTGFSHVKVLQLGGVLDADGAFHKTRVNSKGGTRVAYQKDPFVARHKQQILNLAGNPKKIAKIPTQSNPSSARVVTVKVPAPARSKVKIITLEDVDSFARVKRLRGEFTPIAMPEAQFKRGMRKIIGEPFAQPDWGGEKGDLHTTRVRVKGKRIPTAFAFKGPGVTGALTPSKMGKRGDQIANLFEADAQIFFVQYWDQVDPVMSTHMRAFAEYKAGARGTTVWYGVIDGADSARLIAAYPKAFGRLRPGVRPRTEVDDRAGKTRARASAKDSAD